MIEYGFDVSEVIEFMSDAKFLEFEQRKRDHIALALEPQHQTREYNYFDNFSLVHEAIPDLNFDDIHCCIDSKFQHWQQPFFVSSMTAGHLHADVINRHLLQACELRHWAMGVGSQRRELEDKRSAQSWKALRAEFPNVVMMANLGLAQVITSSIKDLQKLIAAIEAQFFIVHCNPLQEVIQPEGTPQFKGAWSAIEHLVKTLQIPVIVKETGCGFSLKTIQRLNNLGVYAIDVSGLGGTHWGRIEGSRAQEHEVLLRTAQTFSNWGIPTVDILAMTQHLNLEVEIWGSGGIRHGLDAAKALALGARRVGIAQPILKSALAGVDAVVKTMDIFEYELKVAMFCTGSDSINKLQDQTIDDLRKKNE